MPCDLAKPRTLRAALEGVEKAFLVSADIPPADEKVRREADFVDAAAAAGVRHIVYVSVVGTGSEPEFSFRRWHRETERKLEGSGLAWTHLRPIAYTTNLLLSLESINDEGVFHLPTGDGRVTVIDPADIAEVAARALIEQGHEGKAYTLTGPEALSHAEQAVQLSQALGREVRFVDVPEAAARTAMAGLPSELTVALLEFYRLIKDGQREFVAPDFENVTGHAPSSFAAWARGNADAFR